MTRASQVLADLVTLHQAMSALPPKAKKAGTKEAAPAEQAAPPVKKTTARSR